MKTEMIRVYGIVQGVGFRPFVSREASDLGLCGTVANKGSYVEIHAQGSEKAVEELKKALESRPPERSVIMEIISAHADEPPFDSFEIIESEKEKGDIFVLQLVEVRQKLIIHNYPPNMILCGISALSEWDISKKSEQKDCF